MAADLASVSSPGPLVGVAADHASAMVRAALETLELLADLGWRAVVGEGPTPGRGTGARAMGGDAVAERTEGFDPLSALG